MLSGGIDSRAVAIARVGLGIAVVMNAYEAARVLGRIAGGAVAVPPVVALPVSLSAVLALWALSTVSGVMLVLGAAGSVAATGAAVTGAMVLAWDSQAYSNHLFLTTLLCGYLAFARCDSAWSVRAWLRGRRSTCPATPVLLMVTQLLVCYLFGAVSKINGAWLSGRLLREEIWWSLPGWSYQPLAYLVIATELFLVLAVWSSRTRLLALATGVLLHGSIVTMLSTPVPLVAFALACVSVYPAVYVLLGQARPSRSSAMYGRAPVADPL